MRRAERMVFRSYATDDQDVLWDEVVTARFRPDPFEQDGIKISGNVYEVRIEADNYAFTSAEHFEKHHDLLEDQDCCVFCGCRQYDACDPPCTWIQAGVCSTPSCVAMSHIAAGVHHYLKTREAML